MADPIYQWRPTGSQPQQGTYFGALRQQPFGQQLDNAVAGAGGAQSPVAPKPPTGGGGFNIPGGNSAGFASAAFRPDDGAPKPAPAAPAGGSPAPASFSEALRQNPFSQPLVQSASESILRDLNPNQQPSMSSMFALNEYNKGEAESLRQAKEASALNGRAMTGQIGGDVGDYVTNKLIPARQNFLGQLQGQEQQQQTQKQQAAMGNLTALAGMSQQGEQFQQAQAQTKELALADLSLREKSLAQDASQFKDQLSFQKYATDKGFTEQEAQRAWQATQNQAQIASTEKLAMADLTFREQQLAQNAGQFQDQLSFNKWATQQGFNQQEAQRAWQAVQNTQQQASQEKIAFAGLDLQKQQMAQQAMQFQSTQDFQKWATQAGLDQDTQKLVWQAAQNEKDRQLQQGQGDLNRTLQKYIADQGFNIDSQKLTEQVRQFNSSQDFQKWATQAGLDAETAKQVWQANQNDIDRKQQLGMQLTANEQQVRMEGLQEAHDTAMASLNHTLNLDTLDKQQAHDEVLKRMDQELTLSVQQNGFSHDEAMAATQQEYAKQLQQMGYDQQTAMQASQQWFQAQQAQLDRSQQMQLSEAQMAQQYDFFNQDLMQKYNFKAQDVQIAHDQLTQQANQFAATLGLDQAKFDYLKQSDAFNQLSQTTSTLMAMAGDNPDMLRFAAQNFYKGLGNMVGPDGKPMMDQGQVNQGMLSMSASSFKDSATFTSWAQAQKKADGSPMYTPDQISGAAKNTQDLQKATTLVSELSNIGKLNAANIAKWADDRKSSSVDLGDGVVGKVVAPASNGDMDGLALDVGGKKIFYYPETGMYKAFYAGGDHGNPWFKSAKEALAALGGTATAATNAAAAGVSLGGG